MGILSRWRIVGSRQRRILDAQRMLLLLFPIAVAFARLCTLGAAHGLQMGMD